MQSVGRPPLVRSARRRAPPATLRPIPTRLSRRVRKLFTPASYRCMRMVAVEAIGLDVDPLGWAAPIVYTRLCRHLNRVGIVDAMAVDKVFSGGYNWTLAGELTDVVLARFNLSYTSQQRVSPPDGVLLPPPPVSASPPASSQHPVAPSPFPILDVVVVERRPPTAHPAPTASALAAALRARLALHSAFASSTLVVLANESMAGEDGGEPRGLLIHPSNLGLNATERASGRIACLVLPATRSRTWMEVNWPMRPNSRNRYKSSSFVVRELRAELMLWLAAHRPDHHVFLSELTEVLDPLALSAWLAPTLAPSAPRRLHPHPPGSEPAPSSLGAVLRRRGCAVPRLQARLYADERCPLPMRTVHGATRSWKGAADHGWASSAFWFSTERTWAAWRGRQTVVLMAEPPRPSLVNPWVNKDATPPDPAWAHACPVVPSLPPPPPLISRGSPLISRGSPLASMASWQGTSTASLPHVPPVPVADASPYLGWRLLDAHATAASLATELLSTVPRDGAAFPSPGSAELLQLVVRAARQDGVNVKAGQAPSKHTVHAYELILRARHRALAAARAKGGGDDGAARVVKALMAKCIDHHSLGLRAKWGFNETLLLEARLADAPLAVAAVGGLHRYPIANPAISKAAGWGRGTSEFFSHF